LNDFTIDIENSTLQKMIAKKKEMGFDNKNWNGWFEALFGVSKKKDSTINKIENTLKRKTYENFYDQWIINFAHNLEKIADGYSARKLRPKNNKIKKSSAIIIGRGPSINKNNHFQLLQNSNFKGAIICSDGALPNVLRAGITPKKFKNFFVITIDANLSVQNFYKDRYVKKFGDKIKCILSTTVPKTTYDAIDKTGMKIYWLHTLFDYNKGKSSFNYISGIITRAKGHKNGLPAIQTGGNVGTSAWVVAWSILKCTHIGLIGIDHGYTIDTSWEEICRYHEIPSKINQQSRAFKKAFPTIYNPEFDCYCKQDPIFQYYSNALKEFIPKAPKWVKTVNATEGGAIFGKGIECIPFRDFLKKYNF